MCVMLSVKLGESLGQNRHCPGMNCGIVESGEIVDSCWDVGVELFCGGSESVIGRAGSCAVVVVIVGVVSSMSVKLRCKWLVDILVQDLDTVKSVKCPVLNGFFR